MAGRNVSKNNVIAGSFLLISLGLAIAVSAYISGVQDRLIPTREYVVRFSLADGAAGLKPGSLVTLGGLTVGRVAEMSITPTPGQPSLDATVRIRTGISLYSDALMFLERPLLGSGSTINITNVGQPSGPGGTLPEGGMVVGRIAPPAFMAQAGFGPQQAEKVRVAIDQIGDMASRIDSIVSSLEPQIDPIIFSARSAVDDIGGIAADFRASDQRWIERIDGILTAADEAAQQAGPLLTDARAVVSDVQATLDAGSPSLNNILNSLESAAHKLDGEAISGVVTALKSAEENLHLAGRVISEASGYLAEQMPNIRRMLANFRLASDQLKLVTIEVRRNPWRLLYRPETKELESELFYDAARAYASAVSDLRAASESLEAAANSPDPALTVVDRESLDDLRAQIADAFVRYQEAERLLLQQAEEHSK